MKNMESYGFYWNLNYQMISALLVDPPGNERGNDRNRKNYGNIFKTLIRIL